MAPKGGNAKKESGRAKKAENQAKKQEQAAAERERMEEDKWGKGAKASKIDKEEKRKADLARKAENARLLAEEEASVPSKVKTVPKAGKKNVKPAGPGAISASGSNPSVPSTDAEIESFHATGLDNALDLLEVVTAKTDKASMGTQAAQIERHPERRFKAAFEAYQERELPNLKVEHPGLRLQQYKDLLHKQFQKSTENPFNQTTVVYDATKEDKLAALQARKAAVEDSLRS